MRAYSPFLSRFVQFFFGWGEGGGEGWGAIFALAVSIQFKCYLLPSHLHLPYFLVSSRLPGIYSTWAPFSFQRSNPE